MKSFTFSMVAAIAAAGGPNPEEIMEAMENFNPEKFFHEVTENISHEIENGLDDISEDFECWWADRNNGDGICRKREWRKQEDECWRKGDGSRWNYEEKWCMTEE